MEVTFDEAEQSQQPNSTLFSLEECLNLSQKFLKEMNKEQTNNATIDSKSEGNKIVFIWTLD